MPDTDAAGGGVWCSLCCFASNIQKKTHIGNSNNNKSRADSDAFLFKQIEEANTHRRTFIYKQKELFHFVFRPTSKKKESEEIPQQISYDFW